MMGVELSNLMIAEREKDDKNACFQFYIFSNTETLD